MLCNEIMKTRPECLVPTASVLEAARRMRDTNIGFLPVCDVAGEVIGTVTDRDITVRVVAKQLPFTTLVADVMTREIVSCGERDDVDRALRLMEEHQKSRIVCVDGKGKLTGIISLSDVAKRGDASGTLRKIADREAHP